MNNNQETVTTTLISKWAERKRPKDSASNLKQVVIKHKLGYKTANGKTAYRSETRHVPV